jgi:hypothetical protein
VTAPLGMDLDEDRRDFYYPHCFRHAGPDRDREVDVTHAWHIAAYQHSLPDLGPLLGGKRHAAAALDVAAALALLSLAARLGLALLTLLPLRHLALVTLVWFGVWLEPWPCSRWP